MTGRPAKPLIRFETPPEGVLVHCGSSGCNGTQFRLSVHVQLAGAKTSRRATCCACGYSEDIDE